MLSLLFSISDTLEMILNILEFVALVASLCTFFFLMINQYAHLLRRVLGPLGLGWGLRLWVMILCRRSPLKKRAFVEFSLLKTQGLPLERKEWQLLIGQFKAFYDEGSERPVYPIPNCTALIGEPFAKSVRRYFTCLSSPRARKAFGIRDEGMRWVVTVHVEEAYTTPTCLLTGLLSTYEENWSEFIKRYVSTAYLSESDNDTSNDILTSELYFTFAWLLWGPSYELSFRDYWAGLCQLSYGDESNSVPAVADHQTGIAARLAALLSDSMQRRYGVLLSADLSIYETRAFYASLRNSVNPDNAFFYDKAAGGPLPFALRIDGFSPCESYKAKKYYCTAYVWLLFELEDGDGFDFRPEKSVAFFEHANLTDSSTYDFLVDCLIDKSLRHFAAVFARPELNGRRYRFVCAMNDQITARFMQRCQERMLLSDQTAVQLRSRLLLQPRHTPTQAFAAFDDFFVRSCALEYEEVRLQDHASISALGTFYTDIYMECFPNPDERETFDHLLGYLRQAEGRGDYRYHILLARDENGRVVGGSIFDYFPASNAGVIEFIAVRPDSQSGGIGSAVYRQVLSVLARDAFELSHRALDFVFCEIDSPAHSMASVKKYLYFWSKHHYKRLDFSYIQPSLSPAQEAVTGLWLTVVPQNGRMEMLSGEYVLGVVSDYMRLCMQIPDPASHPDFQAMRRELAQQRQVRLLPIV